MHEMSIMQSVFDAAFTALKDSGETRITEIKLTVGEQTDIQEIPLNFAFESLKENTPARNARLIVEVLPTKSHCRDCAIDFEHDRFSMLCSQCGSSDISLLSGRELQIDGMEVDSKPFTEGDDSRSDFLDSVVEEARTSVENIQKPVAEDK
jgi:hydrogenase nickel incorporation protein HypA/HybF